MKAIGLLTMLLATAVAAEPPAKEKPCISFVPESTSETNTYAIDPLKSAVMTSGDFEFLEGVHVGCWAVHVLSLPVTTAKGKRVGYAVSQTVTDPKGMEVGHGLAFGPTSDIFAQAMRKATADAIRNIRLSRSTSQSSGPLRFANDLDGPREARAIAARAPLTCAVVQKTTRTLTP